MVCETDAPSNGSQSPHQLQLTAGRPDEGIKPLPYTPTVNISWAEHCAQKRSFIACPADHVIHTFLSCDRQTTCVPASSRVIMARCPFPTEDVCGFHGLVRGSVPASSDGSRPRGFESDTRYTPDRGLVRSGEEMTSSSVAMFQCADGLTSVHYTLVCDWRSDCPDESDESFCQRPDCASGEFQCGDGRCAGPTNVCDCKNALFLTVGCVKLYTNEMRGLKPELFERLQEMRARSSRPGSPFLVGFSRSYGRLALRDLSPSSVCPKNYIQCPGEVDYCLPLFTRCNGYNDCVNGEDEQGCDDVSCPGVKLHCIAS